MKTEAEKKVVLVVDDAPANIRIVNEEAARRPPMPLVPFRRLFSAFDSTSSWANRIRENVRLLFTLPPATPTAANGAPIHLLEACNPRFSGRAQGTSLFLHFAAGLAIFLLVTYVPTPRIPPPHPTFLDTFLPAPSPSDLRVSIPSEGLRGGSGSNNPLPATRGNFVFSQIQLLKPRLPDQQPHPLVAQPSLQDDLAHDAVPVPAPLGLPWMKNVTSSGGPGQEESFGRGRNGDLGDEDGRSSGRGNNRGPYNPGVTPVMCVYCPDPLYTEEARKAKLQGTVTLRVLVGRDGHALDVRIVGGLGLGLDERAAETVRMWRFLPAKDAAHNPVPTWITIETIYRLF